MRHLAIIAALLLLPAATSFGQVSTDEAMAKLKEKQVAKETARSKQVTISQGELDDLRAEVARLKTEMAAMKSAMAQQASPAAAQPAQAKLVQKIAVGITREELMRFLQVHKAQYDIKSDVPEGAAPPPVVSRTASRSRAGVPAATGGGVTVIEAKTKHKVKTGSSSNGVEQFQDYHEEMRPDATITLKFVNGVVATIDEQKLPWRPDELEYGTPR